MTIDVQSFSNKNDIEMKKFLIVFFGIFEGKIKFITYDRYNKPS